MKQILLVIMLLVPIQALASVEVIDSAQLLTGIQRASLEGTPTGFRVVANFTTRASSNGELGTLMDSCVTTPNTICIGVDPQHRWTSTRFGIDTGVRQSDFIQVSRAGNMEFKEGNWVGGVQSIISRANVISAKSDKPVAVVLNQPLVEKAFPVWPFLVGFGVFALFVIVVISWLRKREQKAMDTVDNARSIVGDIASKTIERDERNDFENKLQAATRTLKNYDIPPGHPAIVANTPSPPNSGVGDFVTGVVIGEALSRHHTPEPVHHSTPAPSPRHSSGGDDSSSSSSYSSGGDSSFFGGGGFGGGGGFSSGGGDSSF